MAMTTKVGFYLFFLFFLKYTDKDHKFFEKEYNTQLVNKDSGEKVKTLAW